jgi:hypothetical protein
MSSPLTPSLLVNSAFALATLGFMVRDILWLRLLTILGYSVFFVWHLTRADGPAWNFLIWYALLMTINGGHAAWLIYERQLVKLTDEECRLRDMVFALLDPLAVKRLLRAGTWLDLAHGDVLTRKGQRPDYIFLIARGEALVSDGDTVITRVRAGQFVGEIAFLRESIATATTTVVPSDHGALRCLAWDRDKLRRRIVRDESMRTTLYAAIGADLATKIAENNVRVTGGSEASDRPASG